MSARDVFLCKALRPEGGDGQEQAAWSTPVNVYRPDPMAARCKASLDGIIAALRP